MPDGTSKMVQMLAALSEMQQRRRSQDLAESQFAESKSQFARSMGFQEKSAEYKKVGDLLDAIARSSSESRTSLYELGKSVGLGPDQLGALMHYGQTAPESMQMFNTKLAQTGYNEAPAGQQADIRAEAASQAMTGMNRGGMAMSGLQNILAAGGNRQQVETQFGSQALADMTRGFLQHTATNQTPFQAAMDSSMMITPGATGQAAGIQYGTRISPYQAGSLNVAGRQAGAAEGQVQVGFQRNNIDAIRYAQEMAIQGLDAQTKAALASARQGGLKPDELSSLLGRLGEFQKDMMNPKGDNASRQRSAMAAQLIIGELQRSGYNIPGYTMDNLPGPASMIERLGRMGQTPGGNIGTMPGFTPAPTMNQGTPYNPMYTPPPAPFFQTPYAPNPLTPFVRP